MRLILLAGCLLMLTVPSYGSSDDVKICRLDVKGMACGACAARVEKVVRALAGVKTAKVSQPKASAEITFDSTKTDADAIAKEITARTGFEATVVPKSK